MSMLDRYRRTGGFVQLLALVETCGTAKQEKFLELIRAEDARWAELLKQKIIDINRIYSWPDETLAEIFGTLQDLTVATALHSAPEALRTRVFAFLTHGRRRKIEDLMGLSKPSAGELASTHVKIIETVRKMANDGFIRFEKFDEPLSIEDAVEDKLSKASLSQPTPSATLSSDFKIEYDGQETPSAEALAAPANDEARLLELSALKKRIEVLGKENAVLRHELNVSKAKLEQIKKIA